MKAIAKRLRRLENLNPSLENATCRRTLCPNGTVLESVEFTTRSNGRELTQEELDKWVASFPVETL